MDMSSAALPAISGTASKADETHPLYNEWRTAESNNRANMINGQNFYDWLYQREQEASRADWASHPLYAPFMTWMRETKAGGRKCQPSKAMPYGLVFPENFQFWLDGGRW